MPSVVGIAYKESSQFRRWTFQPEDLTEKRTLVNSEAITNTEANIIEERKLHEDKEVQAKPSEDYVTVEEEMILVNFYAHKVNEIGNVFKLPSHVKASAIMYLKRFYLVNSVLMYHPKLIM